MKIAFQGNEGSYTDLAVRNAYPNATKKLCPNFESVIKSVTSGESDLGFLPCENSLQGRVAGVHLLLPDTGLHIIGEKFQRVEHCLLGSQNSSLESVKYIHSQDVALNQVRNLIQEMNLKEVNEIDTSYSAKIISEMNDPTHAAVASSLAAEIYNLKILKPNVEDASHNTTRFYVVSKEPTLPPVEKTNCMTTLLFKVRNRPASLYSSMHGFTINGVNITKLESYMLDGKFINTQFLCEVEGHIHHQKLRQALEDLKYHSESVSILGVYEKDSYRTELEKVN